MSNLGLERFVGAKGLSLIRTQVGDRYVLERMRADGFNLGGEQSGHIIMTDHATTGDGLMAALQALASLIHSGKPASEAFHAFEPVPQLLKNVRVADANAAMAASAVTAAIAAAEKSLGKSGRVLVRKSGTEPLIRVMAEGDDEGEADRPDERREGAEPAVLAGGLAHALMRARARRARQSAATALTATSGIHTHSISLASTDNPRSEKNRKPMGETSIGRSGKK